MEAGGPGTEVCHWLCSRTTSLRTKKTAKDLCSMYPVLLTTVDVVYCSNEMFVVMFFAGHAPSSGGPPPFIRVCNLLCVVPYV